MKLQAESRFSTLSLRRFAILLELCKADNQPRRLQDKTVQFQLCIETAHFKIYVLIIRPIVE
jgi:hypothetical protein